VQRQTERRFRCALARRCRASVVEYRLRIAKKGERGTYESGKAFYIRRDARDRRNSKWASGRKLGRALRQLPGSRDLAIAFPRGRGHGRALALRVAGGPPPPSSPPPPPTREELS